MKKERNRKITNKEKDMKKLSGRLLRLLKDNGYDVENDCHAIPRLVIDMEKSGLILNNGYTMIHRHVYDDVRDIDITWLKNYCSFFGCSADYILGYIDKPTHEITDINKKSGLSSAAIRELLKADSDKKIIYDRLVAGGYLNDLVSVINSFYDIGASIQINGEKVTDKETLRNLSKAIEGIKLKMLRDSGADCIHNLAYDSKVKKHFLSSRINLYKTKSKNILGSYYDSSVLDNWLNEVEKEDC